MWWFQKIIMWFGILVIILMGLLPPWKKTFSYQGSYSEKPAGYYFITYPPEAKIKVEGYKIDITRLGLQLIMVSLVTGGLIVTFGRKKRKD